MDVIGTKMTFLYLEILKKNLFKTQKENKRESMRQNDRK